MFLRNVQDRVDVEPVVAEIALLDLEGCTTLLVQLNLVDHVEIPD